MKYAAAIAIGLLVAMFMILYDAPPWARFFAPFSSMILFAIYWELMI